MKDIISKELLSEVFTDGQQDFIVDGLVNNTLKYKWVQEEPIGDGDVNCKLVDMQINVHELAHKCKEWAFAKGYTLQIIWKPRRVGKIWYEIDVWQIESMLQKNRVSEEDTEAEAIFQACQWIYDNKENK